MAFIFEDTILEFILGAGLLLWLIYSYMTSNFLYWKNRSIAYMEPSFPFGTDKEFLLTKQQVGCFYQSVYTKFKEEKVVGMFALGNPYLLIRDSELLKKIMTKDFHCFVDRGLMDPNVLSPTLRHLFHMQGDSWKRMRNKLAPAFTSGKMKMMFQLMETCSNELMKALEAIAQQNGTFAVKELIACFTTDVIASCAFGFESNSVQNPNDEFRANGKKMFETSPTKQIFKLRLSMAFPWLITKLHILKPFTMESEEFFSKLLEDTLAYREKHRVVRNDFVDLLIKIKNNINLQDDERNVNTMSQKDIASSKPALTSEEMTAQAILFFVGGFETVSSALNFCLYELTLNPDVQVKMREEIDEVLRKYDRKLSYDALQDMTYMDAVIYETLRRYPSLSILNRQCTEEYKLPELDLVIPKGMKIVIPLYAISHDPAYYPDPYKFDPERFTHNKISTKNNYTFMPFGGGPRMCTGNRFAMMQMKLCISMLLHKFELAATKETPSALTISKSQFITTPDSPVVLKIVKRKD